MFSHVEQGCAIVPRDAIAIAAIAQPCPKCFIRAKAITCIVQDVDELERALNPELAALGFLLLTVFNLPPSEVEFAFDNRVDGGRCGGISRRLFDLLMNFRHVFFSSVMSDRRLSPDAVRAS